MCALTTLNYMTSSCPLQRDTADETASIFWCPSLSVSPVTQEQLWVQLSLTVWLLSAPHHLTLFFTETTLTGGSELLFFFQWGVEKSERDKSVHSNSQCRAWWSQCSAPRSASSGCWTGEHTHSAGTQGRSAKKTQHAPWALTYCVCGKNRMTICVSPFNSQKIAQWRFSVKHNSQTRNKTVCINRQFHTQLWTLPIKIWKFCTWTVSIWMHLPIFLWRSPPMSPQAQRWFQSGCGSRRTSCSTFAHSWWYDGPIQPTATAA